MRALIGRLVQPAVRHFAILSVAVACGAHPAPITGGAVAAASSDSTLVLFDRSAPPASGCTLRRIDPIAHTDVELADVVEPSCVGARLAWRRDLSRAVAWFDAGTTHVAQSGARRSSRGLERRRRSTLRDRSARTVRDRAPAAAAVEVQEIAYGGDDVLRAYSTHSFEMGTTSMTYLDHALDFSGVHEGAPAAAVSDRRTANGWVLDEVVATTAGWDYAREWTEASSAAGLGPRSVVTLASHPATEDIDAVTRAELDRLAPSGDGVDGDGWAQVATPHGPIYVWMFNGEFTNTTGRIAWRVGLTSSCCHRSASPSARSSP